MLRLRQSAFPLSFILLSSAEVALRGTEEVLFSRARPTAPSAELQIPSVCGGYPFVRAGSPFATGHGGTVNVYFARGVSDDRPLVWKADGRAGVSTECQINEKLRQAGVVGAGCAATCQEGLLLDAVPGPNASAPPLNLAKALNAWQAQGEEVFRDKIHKVIISLLQQTEKMMLAGIVDLDRHYMNVLIAGADEHVAIIDFASFDDENKDYGSWASIPCSSKAAMFGPITLAMAFCTGSPLPPEACTVAGEQAKELMESGLEGVDFVFEGTDDLVDDGLRLFLQEHWGMGVKKALQFDYPMAITHAGVPYSKNSHIRPVDDVRLETREDGSVIVVEILGGNSSKAAEEGVGPGWRLLEIVRENEHEPTSRLPASFPLADLIKASLVLMFEAPAATVEYSPGMEEIGLIPSRELVLLVNSDGQIAVENLIECSSSGRPSRAALAGVAPGWRLLNVTRIDDEGEVKEQGVLVGMVGTDLKSVDEAATHSVLRLYFEAPWSRASRLKPPMTVV